MGYGRRAFDRGCCGSRECENERRASESCCLQGAWPVLARKRRIVLNVAALRPTRPPLAARDVQISLAVPPQDQSDRSRAWRVLRFNVWKGLDAKPRDDQRRTPLLSPGFWAHNARPWRVWHSLLGPTAVQAKRHSRNRVSVRVVIRVSRSRNRHAWGRSAPCLSPCIVSCASEVLYLLSPHNRQRRRSNRAHLCFSICQILACPVAAPWTALPLQVVHGRAIQSSSAGHSVNANPDSPNRQLSPFTCRVHVCRWRHGPVCRSN